MEPIKPWIKLTKEEKENFTLNNKIKVKHWLIDGRNNKSKLNGFYDKKLVNSMIEKIRNKKVSYYGQSDKELYTLLEKINLKDKNVAIIGSTQPWYEAMVIHYGGNPVTIEYSKLKTNDDRLKLLTVEEFYKNPVKFDIIFSISSFEHDGLGRYGDPINPFGDIDAMSKMKDIIKEDGLLFLAVPIGLDTIFWNAHRIYGEHRYPKLIEGWEIVDKVSFNEGRLKKENGMYQPVVVLKKKK